MDNFLNIQKTNIENGLISVRLNGRINFIKTSDLILLNSDLNYTEMHLVGGKKIVSSRTLLLFEGALKPDQNFIRANRSQLINVSHIQNVIFSEKTKKIVLSNGTIIEVSRRKYPNVRNHLTIIHT
jgi:two-component system LytT family response regulator